MILVGLKTTLRSVLFNHSITQIETVITWMRESRSVIFSAGELELIDSRPRHVWDIHTNACGCYTQDLAMCHFAAYNNHSRRLHLKPDFTTSGAHVIYCHQPQRGTMSFSFFFFQNFIMSAVQWLVVHISGNSSCISYIHSHCRSSIWVCNIHTGTELAWERLNVALLSFIICWQPSIIIHNLIIIPLTCLLICNHNNTQNSFFVSSD